ncbi:MAG: hypothetical protein NZ553_17660 [Caldilinea sp.]|nr:hypothetical protein [Caldilinea sp.]MDW8442309.1 hypothetical protein [Caldilineaceae bacterium]
MQATKEKTQDTAAFRSAQRQDDRQPQPQPKVDSERAPFALPPVLMGLACATLLITAGGRTFGFYEWWAFAFLEFVPVGLRWAAGALVAVTATPFAYAQWRRRKAQLVRSLELVAVPLWPATPLLMLVFWIFRERTPHGDALYKLDLLTHTPIAQNPYVWKEPLNSLVEYGMTAAVQPLGWGPEEAIALAGVFAGGVFVVAAWTLARRLSAQPWRRLALVWALGASGASLLWFGHVENYSWSTALTLATLALAIGHLNNCTPLWTVGLVAGAAVSFHPQAAFALPGLAPLLRRSQWPRQVAVLAASGAVFPALTLLTMGLLKVPWPAINGGFAGDSQLFWTPAEAVAPTQLSDALQNLWLVAPLWPFWIGGGALAAFKTVQDWRQRQGSVPPLRRSTHLGKERHEVTTANSARTMLVLMCAAAGLLLYFFTFQNDLPRRQDWDLFAIAGPPLALWGVYAWFLLIDRAPSLRAAWTLRQMLVVGLFFAGNYALFWVGVNHTYTLLTPDAAQRERYVRYRLLDLTELLPQATVTPDAPICAAPVGCERVMLTEFVMPHTGDARPVIFAHAPAQIVIPLDIPKERSFLWLSPALDPQAWGWGGDGVTFLVRVRSAEGEQTLWERHATPVDPADREWLEAWIPLDDYRGRRIDLILATDPGPAGDDAADRAGWGMPWLMRGTIWR